jgi:ADP-ribose pyrophosphatase YjhB (NUDIX family)
LQGIARIGLTYAKDPFDSERYESIRLMAAEMMAAGSGEHSANFFVKFLSKDVGYPTPKVDLRSAVFRGGRLLLVRERQDGLWTWPGGWADIGDSPRAAVVREVKEESGSDVRARKLLALLDGNLLGHPSIPHHAYKLFFLCDLVGGNAHAEEETDAVDFFLQRRVAATGSDACDPSSNGTDF